MENLDKEYFLGLFKRHWLAIGLACIGLIFFIYGLIVLFQTNQQNSNPDFYDFSKSSGSVTPIQTFITIDVEGQVSKPGVYKLKQNSIIQDALISAGGFSVSADRDWVAKNLNLAQKLTDTQKIYIPKAGENAAVSAVDSGGNTSTDTGLININSASESQLDSLPGVGPVTAGKIINNRPYATTSQLLDKKAVSQKVFDEIKDKIVAQ